MTRTTRVGVVLDDEDEENLRTVMTKLDESTMTGAIRAAIRIAAEQLDPPLYCGLRGCTTTAGELCSVYHCPRNPKNQE